MDSHGKLPLRLRFYTDEYREVTGVELGFEQLYQNFKLCQARFQGPIPSSLDWKQHQLQDVATIERYRKSQIIFSW